MVFTRFYFSSNPLRPYPLHMFQGQLWYHMWSTQIPRGSQSPYKPAKSIPQPPHPFNPRAAGALL